MLPAWQQWRSFAPRKATCGSTRKPRLWWQAHQLTCMSSTSDTVVLQAAVEAADVACGLSLGEYTALAFAGAFR